MGRQVDPAQRIDAISRQLADVGERQGFNINHGRTPK